MAKPVLKEGSIVSVLKYPLFLLLIAVTLRLIPVILAWPYPVGFDANAFYLPGMFQGVPSLYSVFFSAQFNQLILSFVFLLYPHPFVILDVVSVALQAMLALSIYLYARTVTKLGRDYSFLAGFVFTLSILSLRLTWDQYRMSFALCFALLGLAFLRMESRNKRFLALPLVVMSILSNPLPAALFLLSMIVYLAFKWKAIRKLGPEIITTVTGLFFFVVQQLFAPRGQLIATSIPIKILGFGAELREVVNGIEFLLFTAWALIILLPLVIFKIKNEFHWIWFGLVLVSAVLGPFGGLGVPPSWIYWLMSFPLSILFVIALKSSGWKAIKYLGITLIVASFFFSAVYLTTSPSAPNPYFQATLNNSGSPTGYLQSTVNLPQQQQAVMTLLNDSLHYVGTGVNSTIYLPGQFFGLALVLPNPQHVRLVNIGEIDPQFSTTNFNQIAPFNNSFTVWLTNPNGWYGVTSLPSNFQLAISDGGFSLYFIS
jgi:hypothetical protein